MCILGEFYKIKLNIFLVLILFISYLVPHDVSANLSFERNLTHDEKKVHDMSNSIMDEEQVTVESEQHNEYISNESKNELDPISEEKENEHDQISDETEIEDDQISNETENEQLNDYNPHVENNDANSSNSNENDITHQNKDDIKNENPEQSKIVEEEIADENPSNKSVKKEIVPKEVKKNTVKSTKAATPSILEKGVRHDSVKTLKVNIKKLGFTVPGNGNDLYGTQTEKKVKEFQKYFGLSVTGKVDKKTNNK